LVSSFCWSGGNPVGMRSSSMRRATVHFHFHKKWGGYDINGPSIKFKGRKTRRINGYLVCNIPTAGSEWSAFSIWERDWRQNSNLFLNKIHCHR
jgi:hypothetical protein